MNRKQLLEQARANGYTGAVDLAAIKAWLLETNTTITLDGKSVDVDAAWTKAHTISADDPAKAAADHAKALRDAEQQVKEAKELHAKAVAANRGTGNRPGDAVDDTKTFGVNLGNLHRKAYNAKAARGGTRFDDADTAEYIGATLRLKTRTDKAGNILPYAQLENDVAIVRNVWGNKTGSPTVNSAYGFFVPDDVQTAVMYATEPFGVARRICSVQPMSRDTWQGNRKTAIVSMSFVAPSGTLNNSDNTYDRIGLTAKEAGVIIRLPNSLLEDSAVNIGDEYAKTFAEAQGILEDQCMFIGDGSSTYGGFVGLKSATQVAATAQATSNTWATQVLGDLELLLGQVANANIADCAYLCSRQYYFQVMFRLMAAGGGNAMANLSAGLGRNLNADAMFFGWPVYFSQQLPIATATTGNCLYFGDFKGGCTLGDRRDLRVETSEHIYFTTDEYAIRATSRIAINVHGDGRGGTFHNIVALKTG